MDVDYHKHLGNEIFFDNPQNMEELFWKLPEYEQQSELRVVIPNINFKQIFDPDGIKYDYKLNTLNVILPHLQEYSEVVSAAEFHSLYFGRIDDRGNTGTFQILKETFSDLTKMLQEQSLSFSSF